MRGAANSDVPHARHRKRNEDGDRSNGLQGSGKCRYSSGRDGDDTDEDDAEQ
jgi:hypothetical protein